MNRAVNFVSIDTIINKVLKNPLAANVNPEDMIDNVASILKLLNLRGAYKTESCEVNIKNHKGRIDRSALNVIGVDYIVNEKRTVPMVMSTSTFRGSARNDHDRGRYNYFISDRSITTSFKEGKVLVVFDTFVLDDDGHPMIPDSEAFILACVNDILLGVYQIMFDLGKLPERSLNRVERDRAWYVGKAQEEFQGFINEDHFESFANEATRWFNSHDQHGNRNASRGTKDTIL